MSASDSVFVRGLEFEANHGYTAAERRSTRRFCLNISISSPLTEASSSDRLSDTVDYRSLCEIALQVGTQSTFKLLEAVAGTIATEIRKRYRGVGVTIELEKLAPPCPGVPQSCGVRLHVPAS